jgi:glycosyltransferase involved in cell wall biosynthesis
MKIAQVAPLWERVPPPNYGGIELVVSHLTDELVRRGHEVTLFATGDSQSLANLKAIYPSVLRLEENVRDYAVYETLELSQVYQNVEEFDLIHSHVGIRALPLGSLVSTPTVHTLHSPFTRDNRHIFTHHRNQHYVSISNAQRQIELNYVGTIHNGIEPSNYSFVDKPHEPPYLAFLGRFSPEKGPQYAITIAKQSGWRLKMAGKVDLVDSKFFEQEIAPHIDGRQIEYLGEINHAEKTELLGNAAITLFPITWQEPFGLVMIESMATGTPVIAINLGSVPEVITHSKTGFICQSYTDIPKMIPAALELNRRVCREQVETKFSITQMVNSYEAVFKQILQDRIQSNGYFPSAKIRF